RICSLMGIRYFVFAVNKMDLVNFSEERFEEISRQIAELTEELSLSNTTVIPLSATDGDNVTTLSQHTPWYKGTSLLEYLEEVEISPENAGKGFYMPVQRGSRPDRTFRGSQGQIEAGSVSVGDEVRVLPSGETASVKTILAAGKETETAFAGQPVTIVLDREVDVS
ncbi:MAG TPA: sulfate adenylyltransferase, partial [Ruminococcus sp.]|nr:sulfate adenylyltransferase [Ruminococcus sp.]